MTKDDIRDAIIMKQDEVILILMSFRSDSGYYESLSVLQKELASLKAELDKEIEPICPYIRISFCGSCNTDTCKYHPNFNG